MRWQGPIEPDEQKRNRPKFERSYFPPIDCAICLKPAHEVIAWPLGVTVNGHEIRGLICRPCWIERLTPEQRKVI